MVPSVLARQLQKGMGDYIETTFPMTNGPFKGSLRKMLAVPGFLYHEPYVAVRLPFRLAESMPDCFEAIHPDYLPYVHQQKAFERLNGDDGRSTLVATGTGSGKTECFLYPILEYCYQHRGEKGIKALIIYPMNALAADQAKRIAELIHGSPELRGNVTAGMYVGGLERTPSRTMSEYGIITDHETMLSAPPDILLTNYKMLDYLLVRPNDARLWQDNGPETLKYIAVDELHTFDGAQGTDLACLLRRLKHRLGIYDGYLCCVGTSATMGNRENSKEILKYAGEIFGEDFGDDAVITEDRLSPGEFFADYPAQVFSIPTEEQADKLAELALQDDLDGYIRQAVEAWLPDFIADNPDDEAIMGDVGRIKLGQALMDHGFLQAVLNLTGGMYYQSSKLVEELSPHYPELKNLPDGAGGLDSLFALVSHARIGQPGKLRPFLNVQVQLWLRELRRLVAKVDGEDIVYDIAHDLNAQQAKQYLPVVNCRDCGITGWVSILNARNNATIPNLEAFYNVYFRGDDQIVMLFPDGEDEAGGKMPNMISAWLCPDCLQVKIGDGDAEECKNCGASMVHVWVPNSPQTFGSKKQYVCPCCGSRRGLSLMGLRSATEISAGISQIFASRFNDDKKTLAFSDNVQDAAHRAGFFNARTWRFGLRRAMKQYLMATGAGQSLAEFQTGFLAYWHGKMTDEDFVSFFIAPNMTWRRAYEDMLANRKLGKGEESRNLLWDIDRRLKYEIMLEFGLGARIGRTLEKSGCAVMSFAMSDVEQIAEAVQERIVNELGVLAGESRDTFQRMVLGFLNLLRMNGAFEAKVFKEYLCNDGKGYMLSNERKKWLPGRQSGRNTPRFLAEQLGHGRPSQEFDYLGSDKYISWLADCCHDKNAYLELLNESSFREMGKFILVEAIKCGVVEQLPSSPNYKIFGLNRERVFITDEVEQLVCEKCGSFYAVSGENADLWQGASCRRKNCSGHLVLQETGGLDYYGRLYTNGDLSRINAREHTGLLERADREKLELDFKRTGDARAYWDPNVLSCTPTLEMGIDIGDLSTVILCSMPPAQSQFLQRAGRAGRKDGNALTLAVANAKPHDLYFYADPLEMVAGNVVPPKVFLKASAVLERQFVAFCLDDWVKKGVSPNAIPDKMAIILNRLDKQPKDMFPFNFLAYVQKTLYRQIKSFCSMFESSELDKGTKRELETFARGKAGEDSPMYLKILDAFKDLQKQQKSLKQSIKELRDIIKELENKPKDSSYEEEIKELKGEEAALLTVQREIGKKNIFNFLSDEGLLPNYAFPEAGIVLRALLYRREDKEGREYEAKAERRKKYDNMVYEYSRSASAAISEFAPNNTFYADGHKLTINQVDLTTSQAAKWRLCPNCSHAALEEAGKNVAACPQCGSPAWADAGQVRTMLKAQLVYSNMDYSKSLISDESDDRSHVFYCRQLLVDVDEEHDITAAYRMDNGDFPFGYEFVRKATLREINFGERETTGDKFFVSGVEEVRKGFRICKHCGKIQSGQVSSSQRQNLFRTVGDTSGQSATRTVTNNHAFTCKVRKNPALSADAFEECLFLYREFNTEILRLLVPATTMDTTAVRLESFVAAFMLGMKEYFGNVDHLRAAVSEVPVANAEYRKQYLVIYDSVPGGTGYLKQLMQQKNALAVIFERALAVMENCSCKDDPQKDGCYHCLYAYRQSQQIGNISRRAAMDMLQAILSGKDHVEKIRKINDIPVNPLFDSELEQMFMTAVRKMAGADNVRDILRNGKHCYYVKIGDMAWEIEPQVMLQENDGVAVPCKPDFIFWPVHETGHKPVAVFTDGFLYHRDIVADDTLKREAIRRSGRFRVWSLSFKDVQQVLEAREGCGDHCVDSLNVIQMPSGTMMYKNMAKKYYAEELEPAKYSSFRLLWEYLSKSNGEMVFKGQAEAYGFSLLEPKLLKNSLAYGTWQSVMNGVKEQTHFTDKEFVFQGTIYGSWLPEGAADMLAVHAGTVGKKGTAAVCSILQDAKDRRSDKYEQAWNGFWRFYNLMQFADEFMAVSAEGMDKMVYLALPVSGAMPYESEGVLPGSSDMIPTVVESTTEEVMAAEATGIYDINVVASWQNIDGLLFEEEAKKFAALAKAQGILAPEEDYIGYEVVGNNGEIMATLEFAWPEKKIGFMTSKQAVGRDKMEALGWSILTLPEGDGEDVDLDLTAVFGGDGA